MGSDVDEIRPAMPLPPLDAPRLPSPESSPALPPRVEALPLVTRPHESRTDDERRLARELAQRQMKTVKRKNSVFGWSVAVIVLAVAGAIGWFGYKQFQRDQDADRTKRESTPPTTLSDEAVMERLDPTLSVVATTVPATPVEPVEVPSP